MLREAGKSIFPNFSCYKWPVYCAVKRFAVDVVEPKVREMDEQESMDRSVINGLFKQGVCSPQNNIFYVFISLFPAYGHWNQPGTRRRRRLLHLCHHCHWRTRQDRPIRLRSLRRPQYFGQHCHPETWYRRTEGEMATSTCRIQGELIHNCNRWSLSKELSAWVFLPVRNFLWLGCICT